MRTNRAVKHFVKLILILMNPNFLLLAGFLAQLHLLFQLEKFWSPPGENIIRYAAGRKVSERCDIVAPVLEDRSAKIENLDVAFIRNYDIVQMEV